VTALRPVDLLVGEIFILKSLYSNNLSFKLIKTPLGKYCEIYLNPNFEFNPATIQPKNLCYPNPCQNNGICSVAFESSIFICNCPTGITGL
jgi:hypothetical protein